MRNWKGAFLQFDNISGCVFGSKNEFVDVVYRSASAAFAAWKDAAIVAA
jgi:hypothetical protein